jgi:hypothetical protein
MGRPHFIEIILLAVCIFVSTALFCVRLRVFVAAFLKAKNDPGYSIWPVWPRVRDFVWEVLCQGLVIK